MDKEFTRLAIELEPENLARDGAASAAAIRKRRKEIIARWRKLETKAGRRVSIDEALENLFA